MNSTILAQLTEAMDTAAEVVSGRSETLIVVLVGIGLVALVLWRDNKRQERDDRRADERQKFQLDKDEKDSESLRLIGAAAERSAEAVELMTQTVTKLDHRHQRDRQILMHLLDALQANHENDGVKYLQAISQARASMIEAE